MFNMNKIIVITSNVGPRSGIKLSDPVNVYENVDYHAFVDVTTNSKIWNQHKPFQFSTDPHFKDRRNAKIYKILPQLFFPDYDYYIWMDITHGLLMDPHEIISELTEDIGIFRHNRRNCIYDESQEILKYRMDHKHLVEFQMNDYFTNGYPGKNGLFELPTFVLKNTPKIKEMSLMWWEQICKYSSRDQLSLPYVLHKLNIKPHIFEGDSQTINKYFRKY